MSRLANALSDLGVGPGDRVASMQVNTNQVIEAYFAAAALDAIYVPFNFRARSEEVAYMLSDADPSVFLVGGRYLSLVDSVSPGVLPSNLIALDGEVPLGGDTEGHWLSYEALLASARAGPASLSRSGRRRHYHLDVHRRHNRTSQGGDADAAKLHFVPADQRHSAGPDEEEEKNLLTVPCITSRAFKG